MCGLRPSALLVSIALAACVPSASDETAPPAQRELAASHVAVVELRAHLPRHDHDQRVAVDVSAHFVESRGIDRAGVMTLLGVWLPSTAANGCIVRRDVANGEFDATVRLLDAGRLGVVGNGGHLRIEPRHIPPWSAQVSGWLYDRRDDPSLPYAWGERYSVWFDGSDEIGPWVADLPAPAPLELVAFNGLVPDDGTVQLETHDDALTIELDAGDDSAAAWLTIDGFGPSASIECRVEGESRVRLDQADLDTIFGVGSPLLVSLRRFERRPLPEAAGIDGELVFSFVDRIEVMR